MSEGIHYCSICDRYFDSPTVHMGKPDEDGAVPAYDSVPVTNGGVPCDTITGPCSCGATHFWKNGERL